MNDLPQGNYPHDTGSFPWFMRVLAAILLLLLGLPIVALFLRALTVIVERPVMIFSQPVIAAAILSLGTTAVSVLIIVVLGTPAAYVFARYEFPFKAILNLLIELPIVMPPVVAGLALLMAFGRRGLLGPPLALLGIELPFSSAAVVIAQVFVASPFYIRAAQARFASIPREIEEAASIDGAGSWRILTDVSVPLSWPSLSIGIVLSWARALGEFGATILFAGNLPGRTQTMPLLVYGALERDIQAAIWVAIVLIGLAVAALISTRLLARALGNDNDADPLASF
jgi:molybdate transport system permease protein